MAEALRFFYQYEAVIYFVLGIGAFVYAVLFFQAWDAMRGSVYGLEQVSAQRRLNQSAAMLIIILAMSVVVFSLVTFICPVICNQGNDSDPGNENGTPVSVTNVPEVTVLPTVDTSEEGCIPGEIEITSPLRGETLVGEVAVLGTVAVNNFGFYKVEVARAEEDIWLTIQAGRQLVEEADLIPSWDTSLLPPGDYVLQLIVTYNDGDVLPPCRIPIRVGSPE